MRTYARQWHSNALSASYRTSPRTWVCESPFVGEFPRFVPSDTNRASWVFPNCVQPTQITRSHRSRRPMFPTHRVDNCVGSRCLFAFPDNPSKAGLAVSRLAAVVALAFHDAIAPHRFGHEMWGNRSVRLHQDRVML